MILPIIIGLLNRKSLNSIFKLFLFFLIFTLLKEIACVYLASKGQPNLYIYNIFGILAYIVYPILYYNTFTSEKNKRLTLFFLGVIIIAYLSDLLFINGLEVFNTLTTTTGGFILATSALLYLYQILKNIEHSNIIKVPMFWISVGVLFYNIGTIVLFSYFNEYITLPSELRASIWTINSILNILHNILLAIGLFWIRKKTN